MDDSMELSLDDEHSVSTLTAVEKYMEVYNLESREAAIRALLPDWAVNPRVNEDLGLVADMIEKSRHYELDLDSEEVAVEFAAD